MITHNFCVGDRVRAVDAVDGYTNLIGVSGTVVHVRSDDMIGVEFDVRFHNGHGANGFGKPGFCRYGSPWAFERDTDVTEFVVDIPLESLL